MPTTADLTTVILAGGRATRFPGKLEHDVRGMPLLACVYGNVRGFAPVIIAARDTFSSSLDALLDCPIVVDAQPGRGPLAGLLGVLPQVRTARIFALAGDAPNVTRDVPEMLLRAWTPGDEAVVPEHDGRIEPLAALYDRAALEREGRHVVRERDASMRALLERLRVRPVAMRGRYFTNVNTARDLHLLLAEPS
jgi:molybdopterin-guanine dinucleotide biosynthesis protein A